MRFPTPAARLSFCYLDGTADKLSGKVTYRTQLVIDPNTPDGAAFIQKMKQEVEAVIKSDRGIQTLGTNPNRATLKLPYADGTPGDAVTDGMFIVKAKNKNLPKLFTKEGFDAQAGDFYSGCYARALISVFPYNSGGVKGVFCVLEGLKFDRDGEALGGGAPVSADEFGDYSDMF